jgi:protein-disulfide isomerase
MYISLDTWQSRLCQFSTALCVLFVTATINNQSLAAESKTAQPAAEVNGEIINMDELDRALGSRLVKLTEQIYDLRRQELDRLVEQKLLAQEAAKRKISVPALLDEEVNSRVGLVTETEIDQFYQQNKARWTGDEDEIRQKIRPYLQQQKLNARRSDFVQSLRSKANVVVRLSPPPVSRVEVSSQGAPVRGAPDAPVTVVEFSDFECPFCKSAQGTLAQILERYSGKVKLVYRDLPLEGIHLQARRASEAARCANDQGKFWEYHDVLFRNAPQLAPNDLTNYAKQVGIDLPKFDTCLNSGVHKLGVQRDIDEARRLGVNATPVFFINGRLLSGAAPIEGFAKIIDEELVRIAAERR